MKSASNIKLSSLLGSLQKLDALPESKREARVNDFMSSISELYLDYFVMHLDEAKKIGFDNQTTIKNIFKEVSHYYEWELENLMLSSFEWHDPWEAVCVRRTALTVFEEMFGDISGPFDLKVVDEMMRERERKKNIIFDKNRVPVGMPKEHWWWFV